MLCHERHSGPDMLLQTSTDSARGTWAKVGHLNSGIHDDSDPLDLGKKRGLQWCGTVPLIDVEEVDARHPYLNEDLVVLGSRAVDLD
jgi:hypothetical protein